MDKIGYEGFARRFSDAIDKFGGRVGQGELAEMFGTSQSVISKARRGIALPPDSVMEKMRDVWGVDMVEEVRELREQTRYSVRKKALSPSQSSIGIPYYDVDFLGGFDLVCNDQTVNPDGFVNIGKFNRATCLCNITGHSMEPEIEHGDIIVLRKIEDWSFLPYGEIYAIVTRNEMRTVKRLGRSPNPDCYMLIPANRSPEYSPQEIRKADILYVFEVMGCMRQF